MTACLEMRETCMATSSASNIVTIQIIDVIRKSSLNRASRALRLRCKFHRQNDTVSAVRHSASSRYIHHDGETFNLLVS